MGFWPQGADRNKMWMTEKCFNPRAVWQEQSGEAVGKCQKENSISQVTGKHFPFLSLYLT